MWKKTLILSLILLFLIIPSGLSDPLLVSGSGFDTLINMGQSISFQNSFKFVLHVQSGTLNGSSCTVNLYGRRGNFGFTSNEQATIHAYTYDVENVGFGVSGATFTGSNSSFTISVPALGYVSITWFIRLVSYVDEYTNLSIGLGGVILMIFSPTWMAWKIRKSGADVSTVERFGYAMLLFLVGFGLFVIWLWG